MRYPLIDPQGNFGSIDNDPPAAMRYTEARLSRLATEMLRDIDADTVEFGPNYDESRQEPLVLPARFPNLLVNGSSGIAVGMATNIPPHNLREAIDAVVAYIDDPAIDVDGLMKHIKGPDFPTGGIIVGHGGIRDAYETGRGRVVVRGARAHRADGARQGAHHRHRDALPGLQGRRARRRQRPDAEDRRAGPERPAQGDLRPPRRVRQVRASGWSSSSSATRSRRSSSTSSTSTRQLQTTFGVNMVALVDGVPRTLGLLPIVKNYVDHQRDVIVRRTKHELREREARLHILEGLLDRDREHRRGDRADPRLARPGRRARRADRALRALAHPGPGDPRPAPRSASPRSQTDEIKTGARRRRRAHQVAARASSATRPRSWA